MGEISRDSELGREMRALGDVKRFSHDEIHELTALLGVEGNGPGKVPSGSSKEDKL